MAERPSDHPDLADDPHPPAGGARLLPAQSGAFDFEPSLAWCRAKGGTKWRRPGPDALPAWVADMDFAPCPAVADAITGLVAAGDLGYPDWDGEPLADAFCERMAQRYGWSPDPSCVRHATDLIQAFEVTTTLATAPGDGVAAHVPNYPPFLGVLKRLDRRLVPCPVVPDGASWSFDARRLDEEIARSGARMLLVVNPHNPTGRAFRQDELAALADLACRRDLVIVSDEIHAELLHDPARHVPFATLGEEVARRTVTVGSASKSFNLAGLRTAVVHIGAPGLRAAWDALPSHLLGSLNVVGVAATLAAWSAGDPWLDALRLHLTAQRDRVVARIAQMRGLVLRPPEATYLAWIDCREAGLGDDPAEAFRRSGVALSPGRDYGPGGEGYVRLNFATGRGILEEILDRMAAALGGPR